MHHMTDERLLQELERRFTENKLSLLELQRTTTQLKELNKKLEESEALKTHFISNITNEIINPFAAILGLSRSILDVKKENWDKVMSMINLIHTEAFHLDFQLRNIFAAAKLEAGEWVPEIMKANIEQTIESTIDNFRYELEKKQIRVEYNNGCLAGDGKVFSFHTDADKLRIILSNLLSNAAKYSYTNSQIIIRSWVEDENLLISVEDFGTGISEGNQKIIFDRFTRIDSGINSLNRGHGLGLSINKALIDLLDGEIRMESQLNKGTLFTIVIPPGQVSDELSGFAMDGNEFLFDEEAGQETF
jgi:signal transduction histidine kinase